MPTILVFPNKLDNSLFETNQIAPNQTLEQWLIATVPAYVRLEVPLFSATLNGIEFAPAQWPVIKLREGDQLLLTVEAKEPATIFMAVIAVIAVATTVYAMSQMPPDSYNSTTPKGSVIYDANAQGNSVRLMGIIPELFGRHKTYPDLLSAPHRYYQNNDQYIDLMLAVGVGEYDISDMMIGNTPISHYGSDIEVSIYGPGASTSSVANIYTSDEVGSTSGTSGMELGSAGPFQAAPASQVITQMQVDFLFAQGLAEINTDGDLLSRSVTVEVFMKKVVGWNTYYSKQQFTYTAATLDQLGFTETITVPSGYSLVNALRVTPEDSSTSIKDKVEWVGLKAILPPVASYPGVTTIHLKLKGTNAIANNAQNKFNLVATRKLYGTATRSIADVFEYIIKDNGHTSSQIGTTELARLNDIWDGRGDTFDAVFDNDSTIFAALKRVLAVGFAEPTLDGGQIIPVRDEPRTGFNYMYQPDNMLKPLKHNILLFDPDENDGIEVEYFSTETWKPETILCMLDDDLGIRPKKVRAYGITDRTKAWQFGMRKRRAIRYQRKEYVFQTEMDGLNSTYLSYDSLADDIPGFSQTGRLDAVTGKVLELNQPVEFSTGTHFIALRKPDGTLDGPHVCTAGAHDQQVILATNLGFFADCSGRIEPPLYQFGVAERWNYPVLVTDVTPSGTDSVKIKAVNYDVRVYADDDNSPPA